MNPIDKIDQLTVLRKTNPDEYKEYLKQSKQSIKDLIKTEMDARKEIEQESTKGNQEKIKSILCR
ncbi:MAG: hypothetical protein WC346_04435 [Methanogenium sp.]